VEDFDLRIQHEGIESEALSALYGDSPLKSGVFSPKLRLSGYPQRSLVASLEAEFAGITFAGQPSLIVPATGSLRMLANYDAGLRQLDVTAAQVRSNQISGSLDGTVDFSGTSPQLDLRLQADQLPFTALLDYALNTVQSDAGEVSFDVSSDYSLELGLRGTLESPSFTASTSVREGMFHFSPAGSGLPEAHLNVGGIDVTWDSETLLPTGSLRITGGFLKNVVSGLDAQDVTGSITLSEDSITLSPLSASFTGNPIVGQARYDLVSETFSFELDGTVANVEQLELVQDIQDLYLAGSVGMRANGKYRAGGLTMDMSLDATQAAVGFEWWFRKPVGVGTTVTSLNLDYAQNRSITFSGSVSVGTTPIAATVEVVRRGGAWKLESIRAKGTDIDAATANKCLNVPYTLESGHASEVNFTWERAGDVPEGKIISVQAAVDSAEVIPDTGSYPIKVRDLSLDLVADDSRPDLTGRATIEAGEVDMPPFGALWFTALRPSDPELLALYPEKPRDWTFTVNASRADVPPWQGRNLSVTAKDTPGQLVLEQFEAEVDDGMISGSYRSQKADHLSALDATWTDVPAKYLIEHLDFPDILSGTATGRIAYQVDEDDPNTLQGEGSFDIRDGRFSPDFVFQQLTQTLEGDMNVLPPSLDFSSFSSGVRLEGDRVTTNGLTLAGQGLTITADGSFFIDGDMDYRIKVSIAPDTAQEIPLIRDYFNIQGHKISQNTIDLEFQVSGPTFKPRGQVAGLPPVGVTLVSGAFEMTSEAVKIIDLPRQLLIDLFKIGGGIVGSQKQ
jgi:hypothetical protein